MLKIAYFDDDQSWLDKIETLLILKKDDLVDDEIVFRGYLNDKEIIEKIKSGSFNYDYVILDIYDKEKGENVAKDILDAIKAYKKSTSKVILFSIGSTFRGAVHQLKYSKEDYPFLLKEHIVPKASIDELVEIIIDDYLENNTSIQFDYMDKDDILLKSEINSIGEKYISLIIRNLKKKKNINSQILVERMSSGFSGASVFKLHINNNFSILKVSKEKDKLDKEIENAEKYYLKLPPPFRINITDKEDYSTNGIGAYLIENVPNGITLFDFLKKNKKGEVIQFLKRLFIDGNCMKSFYAENIVGEEKYYFINKKFNKIIYSKVKLALIELSPLVKDGISNNILDYIQDDKYGKIRPDGTLKKNKILICHGDFHSKNIMISNGDPTIIDTGGMKEDYWCMDICRLITNLFIEGFDYGIKKYFDINEIDNQVIIAKQIINLEKIKSDDVNNGIITALNWLIENVENIYGEMFFKWEFQLGLLKEFLQVSYRKNSIPPNKRAIAILSAYECLISANKLFK